MCGRFTYTDPDIVRALLLDTFGLEARMNARFNVAPGQTHPIVSSTANRALGVFSARWGFIPFWEKSERPRVAPINARSEDVLSKPAFRQAIQRRRCAVPADGFFEWGTLPLMVKQPFFLSRLERRPFFFAGIYEEATASRPPTFAVMTTQANALIEPFYHRSPVILTGERARGWVRAGEMTTDALDGFRTPFPAEDMQAWPVSTIVNKPAADIPECIVRVDGKLRTEPAPPVQSELF